MVAEVEEVLVVDMVLVGDLSRLHFKIIFQLISRVCLIKPAEFPISIIFEINALLVEYNHQYPDCRLESSRDSSTWN